MYNLGDKVVYPMHGAGKIESVEEREILGEIKKYYILKMPIGDIKLMIPVDNVKKMGLRNIINRENVKDVLSVFEQTAEESNLNWNKRYRENMEKMRSGDIYEIAHVVRDLAFRDREKGLSTGEKKMLVNAKQMLISEIALSTDEDGLKVTQDIEDVLEKIV